MRATMKKIFYFCIVKSCRRHEVAAKEQRFLWSNFLVKLDTERIMVCGSSNAHKVSAYMNLTAPCALYLLTSN